MNSSNNKETEIQRLAEQKTKQRMLQEKIDSLVKAANESLNCGADCMKERREKELQKKYLAAKEKVEDAPSDFKQAEESYFTFVNGKVWYNNFLNQKNTEVARIDAHKLNQEFLKKHDDLKKDIQYYESQNAYMKNMNTLLTNLRDQNSDLKKETDKNKKTVQTSSRLSFYYDDDIETINDWISVFNFIYWVIFSAIIIKFLVLDLKFKDLRLWAYIAFFAIFPYIIFPIHDWLKNTVRNVLQWFDLLERRIVA